MPQMHTNLTQCFLYRQPMMIVLGCLILLLGGCAKTASTDTKIPEIPTENTYSDAVRLKALSDAIGANPTDPENFFRRATLHFEMDNLKPAYDDALRATALDSNQGKYYLILAKIFVKLPNMTEADVAIKKAKLKGLDTPELHVTAGQILYIQRKYPQALDALNKALKVAESYAPAYLYKGLVYAELGDTTKAISNLQTAIEQAPDQVDAYNKLASINIGKRNFPLAKQYLVSGLRFAPRDPFIYLSLGDFYESQNQADTAKEYYKRAMFFDPELYVPYLRLGSLAAKNKNWTDAISNFKLAVDHSTTDDLPTLYLAQALERDNQLAEALYNFKKLVTNNSAYQQDAELAVKRLEPLASKKAKQDSLANVAKAKRDAMGGK